MGGTVSEQKVRRVFRLRHAGSSRVDLTGPPFTTRDGLVQGSHQPVAHWIERLHAAVENELGPDLLGSQQRALLVRAMTDVARAAGDPANLRPALTRLVRAVAAIGRPAGPVTDLAFQAVRALNSD
jgi:hypothetical protein